MESHLEQTLEALRSNQSHLGQILETLRSNQSGIEEIKNILRDVWPRDFFSQLKHGAKKKKTIGRLVFYKQQHVGKLNLYVL